MPPRLATPLNHAPTVGATEASGAKVMVGAGEMREKKRESETQGGGGGGGAEGEH